MLLISSIVSLYSDIASSPLSLLSIIPTSTSIQSNEFDYKYYRISKIVENTV